MTATTLPWAIPLLTADEIRAAERAWFAGGHDSFDMMQEAAAGVANALNRLTGGEPCRCLVLAGPGNNGGDALVVAHLLETGGHAVTVVGMPPADGWTGDAARARELWGGPVLGPGDPWPEVDLIVDGLFGIGLSRAPVAAAADLIARANAHGAPILAIDVPSGVDSDSGAVPGAAIRATATVTFHAAKPGHWLFPGRAHAGALTVADIGLPPTATGLWRNGPGLWRLPEPSPMDHKYSRGAALVWSGPELATGASRLAAQAALRAGAGAVTLVGAAEALRVHAAHVTAIMLREGDAQGFGRMLEGSKVRAACVGPGAGEGVRTVAVAALQAGKALVLDADALTAFAGEADHLAHLIARHPRPVVLTPHEGEFARLFPDLSGGKVERARAAAVLTGAALVLKGCDSVIAAPDGRTTINANAPKWLATAGSGDVLAGIVTGFLAQGMEGFEAAAAAWMHGATAARLGPALNAEDLVELPAFRDAWLEASGRIEAGSGDGR
ncbi:NAD(P)H-hydrate dehydratase [Thermaurantiacus sp.]